MSAPKAGPYALLDIRCRCGRNLKAPASAVGQTGRCPFCASRLRLVSASDVVSEGDFVDRLIIARGPVREGEQILLGGTEAIEIGKLSTKPIFLPGQGVSRTHAKLLRSETGWRIQDLGSTNGIVLNGERATERELLDGDVIEIGEFVLEYMTGPDPSAADIDTDPASNGGFLRQPRSLLDLERMRAQLIIAMNQPSQRRRRNWKPAVWVVLLAGAAAFLVWRDLQRPAPPADHLHAAPEDLTWFQDAKFGVMLTWGPVSLTGQEISWSRQATRPGEAPSPAGVIPADTYDHLYEAFNPDKFNARSWIHLLRRAGARYVVIVTKHHDGFCMFESRLTPHHIGRSPFGRDVIAELATACRQEEMKLGFYFSPRDWRHPDYATATHHRYIPFLHGLVQELCVGYGPVDLFWFDAPDGQNLDWDADGLFRMIRRLQPGVLINNRLGLEGDFDVRIGEIGPVQVQRPWEACLQLGSQWSYKPDDAVMPLAECLGSLLRTVGSGGNLLLNVGPRPDGIIDPAQAERLRQIGDWLARYGESVYGTRAGPYPPDTWGVSTRRGKEVYLHVLDPAVREIVLPGLKMPIESVFMLSPGDAGVRIQDKGRRFTVVLRPQPDVPPPWVIRLTFLDPPAEMIARH